MFIVRCNLKEAECGEHTNVSHRLLLDLFPLERLNPFGAQAITAGNDLKGIGVISQIQYDG